MANTDKYQLFVKDLRKSVDRKRIYTDELRRFAWGTDAGFYRMTPKVVVRAADINDVVACMKLAYKHKLPVTFRAAGTSLSGQAISDSILIVAGKNMKSVQKDAP